MSKSNFDKFMSRLTTEIIYLSYPFEDCVIRSEPGAAGGYFVKFKGESEFRGKNDSKLITDALLEHREITKNEYDNF